LPSLHLKDGLSPFINVVGVVVIVVSLIPVYVAQRLARDPVALSAH
jgi:ABC-type spermidine/putrescine transport system permease subunit II